MNLETYFSCHAPTACSPESAIEQLRHTFLSRLDEAGIDAASIIFSPFLL